jgi:hypothetical protein
MLCSASPQPDRGSILSAVDFTTADTPGWRTSKYATVTFGGSPPAMVASLTEHTTSQLFTVLKSEGVYDDLDLSVTIRHLEGVAGTEKDFGIRAGVSLRLQGNGQHCYICDITEDGWFGVHTIFDASDKPNTFSSLVKRTRFSGLRRGWGVDNRLRVIATADRIRVFLNDQLAASIRDDRYTMGKVELLVNPSGGPGRVAFSDLLIADP